MKSLVLPVFAAASLPLAAAACSAPYDRASGPDDTGYTTTRASTDTFRVSFTGNDTTSRETVETYLLYHAATVTEKNGYDWFSIEDRSVDEDITLETFTGYRTTPGFYGYALTGYPYYTTFPYGGGGGNYTSSTGVAADNPFEATAFIEVYDQRPAAVDRVYNASDVIERLGPRVDTPMNSLG